MQCNPSTPQTMYDSWFTASMSDNAIIRLENLKALKLSAAELSLRVTGAKSYWHGMLAGDRPFGEKIARKIEEKLELERGWLDEPQSGRPKMREPDQEIPSTSTILLSLTDDAVQLGSMFDKMPQEIKAGLYLAVTEYMLQSRRVFLRDGTHPEFLQLDTRPGKSLLLPDEDNEPAPPAGARASQQQRRIRQGTHSQ